MHALGRGAAHSIVSVSCIWLLLSCLCLADGQVLVDGYDLTQLDAQWYRSRLGVVSQEPRLFSCNVRDNIGYGCPYL